MSGISGVGGRIVHPLAALSLGTVVWNVINMSMCCLLINAELSLTISVEFLKMNPSVTGHLENRAMIHTCGGERSFRTLGVIRISTS